MTTFEDAVQWIASSSVATTTQTKLKLYALFKIATTTSRPTNSRPGMLDFSGRAKWDAWDNMGKSGYEGEEGKERAKQDYVREARALGYSEGEQDAVEAAPKRVEKKEQAVSVSQMKDDFVDEAPPSRLHDLSIDGDVAGLEAFLSTSEGESTQIDQRDSYGYSALHLATDRGNLEVVKILIARGADKDAKDEDGNTPLDLARLAEHDSIVTLLLSSN
ncbi:uncharacterized protein JCM6883_000590 [Sporobolomyces salmoneus]|uniref:uncharacterized protein n=1 Tax=Sporobolomyces salmoneus TaxID=183962 RepID=UPI0031705D6B